MDALTDAGGVGLLATTAGIAGVVFLVMQAIRKALDPDAFAKWAAILAMVIGVVLAELYAFAVVSPITTTALVGGLVSGLVGGALSQNANTAWRRIVDPPPGS